MEQNEISTHEVAVFNYLKANDRWLSNEELSRALDMSKRTVRSKTKKFLDLGLCDVAEVFPGHRYRFSDKANKRNAAYLKRLEWAAAVFGQQS